MRAAPFASVLFLAALLPSCQVASPPESETAPADWTPLSAEAIASSKQKISFTTHVAPVLEAKCLACHSGSTALAGFSLENRQSAFHAGPSGSRIIPGDPEHSRLLTNISAAHSSLNVMPPVGDRLINEEKEILRRWDQTRSGMANRTRRDAPGTHVLGREIGSPLFTGTGQKVQKGR